ncbi:glycerophosphodiester phosphodiesterase family protein [Enterococcus sp. AZ192]|uniref:glycerophosphodiester phosphodiesterase family protein n=1 Tax=unclassified Enterococcus TaxID=2608891 RepID=UPI003D2AAA44
MAEKKDKKKPSKKKQKKKEQAAKRKKKRLTLSILLIVIILSGVSFLIWFYINLDYQDHSNPSYEGYRFSPSPLAITLADKQKEDVILEDGSRLNPDFAESSIERLAKNKSVYYPPERPSFRLLNQDNKQTTYRLSADLESVNHLKTVEFSVFGETDGTNDLKTYQAVYHSETNTWDTDVLIKNHQEAGDYQVTLKITRENGEIETVPFGNFTVDQPTLQSEIDGTEVSKGQFEINLSVSSKSDTEKLTATVWSKEDQSDKKVYDAKRQEGNSYKVHVDYEDFDFINGIYHANTEFIGKNGLKAESDAGAVEINLRRPVRIRLMQETALYQNRQLSKAVRQLSAHSMAYVRGIVFNNDKKIYRTTEGYIPADNVEVSEMMDDIRYVAHRGNHKAAPENSLPAFQQSNSWGIETDIRLTKDKKWVIMHDQSVDRMTNGKGKVSDLTLAQINALRIDQGSNKENYSEEQLVVPTLEDFLTVMNTKQSIPFIEIKANKVDAADYDSLVNSINYYGLANTAVVISFDYKHLVEVKRRLPDVQVQLLANRLDEQMIEQVSQLGGNSGLDIKYESVADRADLIALAQNKGLSVNLWGVPQSEFKKMEALGINNLTTDYD